MKDWQDRWRNQQTGWDIGSEHPVLPLLWQRAVAANWVNAGERVFVPGCGAGHEAAFVAKAGWSTKAVDYVPEAIREASKAYGGTANLEFAVGDALAVAKVDVAQYGVVVDRAMLCAIDEVQRRTYLEACARRLHPGGVFLGILFSEVERPPPAGGPPHAITPVEIVRLMAGLFTLVEGWEQFAPERPAAIKREFCCIWRRI